MLIDNIPICSELTVVEEAHPLASPSLSDHLKRLLNGSGDIGLEE